MTVLATSVTTTSVDVGAATGLLVVLAVIAISAVRLVAALRDLRHHNGPSAEMIDAMRKATVALVRSLTEENERLRRTAGLDLTSQREPGEPDPPRGNG